MQLITRALVSLVPIIHVFLYVLYQFLCLYSLVPTPNYRTVYHLCW